MSGPWFSAPPRRVRRGAALTLVFASVLATGAATGSWGGAVRALGTEASGSAVSPQSRAALRDSVRGADDGKGAPRDLRTTGGTGDASRSDAADVLVSRSGDRWSGSYSADEYEGLRQALDGTYVGVGLTVRQVRTGSATDDRPAVAVDRVRPGSPAARAGIRPGDRLRSVDGAPVTGLPVTDVVARLRGSAEGPGTGPAEPGTEVELRLSRPGGHGVRGTDGRVWTRTLTRVRLRTDAVTVERLGHGATRIKVSAFTKGSGEQVRRAVRERVPAGSGILLDLRGNSGGLVDEAVTAASAFLDGGLVATYDDNGEQRALYAEPGAGDALRPVVVLVDGGTMSAAELLTGALQDRGRAVVVGSRTFGKGTVQMPSTQPDGSVAELTVGRYTTPSGRDVEGAGLAPDLKVGSRRAATERARTVLGGLETRS